ncbi:acyl-CoA dehydrogenase N-terminal domain-containing protein, partial [Rhodococcus rhodnii]
MGHYKSNVRDLEFNLFELLGIDQLLGQGAWSDLDADTVKNMLSEVARLAEGPLAEAFADADRNPPVFDPETHEISLPESFKKSFKSMWDAEWYRMGLS